MKKLYILLVCVFFFNGCAGVQNSTGVDSDIRASEFNSFSSQYLPRPTFINVNEMSNGYVLLSVKMDMYGNKYTSFGVGKQSANAHIEAINKFLKWEEQATSRGDIFTKDIDQIASWQNTLGDVLTRFQFHSGNNTNHYLVVSRCAIGTCLDDKMYFDKSNAIKLKKLIEQFRDGKVKTKNIDDIYK